MIQFTVYNVITIPFWFFIFWWCFKWYILFVEILMLCCILYIFIWISKYCVILGTFTYHVYAWTSKKMELSYSNMFRYVQHTSFFLNMPEWENQRTLIDTCSGKNWENWKNLIKCENGQTKLKIFKGSCTLMLANLFWNAQAVKEIWMLSLSTQTMGMILYVLYSMIWFYMF